MGCTSFSRHIQLVVTLESGWLRRREVGGGKKKTGYPGLDELDDWITWITW